MTNPEGGNTPRYEQQNTQEQMQQTPGSPWQESLTDIVNNSKWKDKAKALQTATMLDKHLDQHGLTPTQEHHIIKTILWSFINQFKETSYIQNKASTIASTLESQKPWILKDTANNIVNQSKKRPWKSQIESGGGWFQKIIDNQNNIQTNKNKIIANENKEQERKEKENEYKAIIQKISATRALRANELANDNVRQAHTSYETAIKTKNAQALSTLTSSLSKTQTDQDKATNPITASDVSQMLFFRRLVKDQEEQQQSTTIPEHIRAQFADPSFAETFDTLSRDFDIHRIDITNPYEISSDTPSPMTERSIATLADHPVADEIANTPQVRDTAQQALGTPPRPDEADMANFDSEAMADKLGIAKTINFPAWLPGEMFGPLQYSNIFDDLLTKNPQVMTDVTDNQGKTHHVVDHEYLAQEYGNAAPRIANALLAYQEITSKPEAFAGAPDEIKNRFLTAIKRGTDEMMLSISDEATETLAQQTSETYLQNIADSFTHNADTTIVWSPEYDAEGQLVLTLTEDRQGTDATYQLIFTPDGTVTRTNVSLTMDDTDHPVDFVRNGAQVITTNFPSVTDIMQKNADALAWWSLYDSLQDNSDALSLAVSEHMRETLANNDNGVDVQLAMTQAELAHASAQSQAYENMISVLIHTDAAAKNIAPQTHPLYHKLLSWHQEKLGTGDMWPFAEQLVAIRNTTESMSTAEVTSFNQSMQTLAGLQQQPRDLTAQLVDPALASMAHKDIEWTPRALPTSPAWVQITDSGMDIFSLLSYNSGDHGRPIIDTWFFDAMAMYASSDQAKTMTFDQSSVGQARLADRSGHLWPVKQRFEEFYGAFHGEWAWADAMLADLNNPSLREEEWPDGEITITTDNTPWQEDLDLPTKPFILHMTDIINGKEATQKENAQTALAQAREKFDNGQQQTMTQNNTPQNPTQNRQQQIQQPWIPQPTPIQNAA